MFNKDEIAAIVVDVQNAFMPTGSLPVTDGDQIVPIINSILPFFGTTIFTKDWHPDNHVSFADNHPNAKPYVEVFACGVQQILWPKHAVMGTLDAEWHSDLNTKSADLVILKGQDTEVDSLSAFQDNIGRTHTELAPFLTERRIKAVFLMGLALDYCVKYTALDCVKLLRIPTYVVTDATKPAVPDKGDAVLKELESLGIKLITSHQLHAFVDVT
jgi:nicotinamidase/pyrazinamidase